MKPSNHEQAQRWLQARIDEVLSSEEEEALQKHLGSCAACRQYAAQIEKLDTDLRRHFHQQMVSRSPSRASESVSHQVRAKMFTKRIWNFAGSAVLVLTLLAAMGGLAFLTTRTISTSTAQNLTATTPPTATTLPPTPTPEPLNTAEEIAAVLQRLAGRNAALLQQPGWVRAQSFNAAEDAASMAYYSDRWQYYPQSGGVCSEKLIITRATPDDPNPIQFMMWTGGTYGDLLELRKGRGEVQTLAASEMQCAIAVDQMPAGELALRLLSKSTALRKDAGKDLQTVEAWYDRVNDRPVVVVKAEFHNDQSFPPVQVEQYSFDMQSGLLLRQSIAMQNADGSPFSNMALRIQTDFYAELPAESARVFEEAIAELAAFQTGEVAALATPIPTSAPGTLDALPTRPESALTDMDAIVTALRALRERHLQWLSRPGWYTSEYPLDTTEEGWIRNYGALVHSIGEGRCELMTYFRKPDEVLPQQIQLADGSWGLIGTVESGVFTEGKPQEAPCTLETLESVSLLNQAIEGLPEMNTQQSQIRAWVGKAADPIAGRAVLVVVSDITYTDPKPRAMDPDIHQLEALNRAIEWNLYDLETGTPLGIGTQFFLGSGKVLGELPDWSAPMAFVTPLYQYTYSEQPPADLAEAFEKAVQGLEAFLQK